MNLRAVVAAAAVVASISAFAPRASAEDEPEVRYPPSSVRIPVILAGVGVFGAAYGLGVASSREAPDVPGAKALAVPLAGPWIALAQNGCSTSNPDCGGLLYLRGALLVFEGIVQIAGTGLVIEGIVMKTEAAKKTGFLEVKRGDFSLRPVPFTPTVGATDQRRGPMAGQVTGLGFTGTF
jgi:hypothetical protein